MPDSGSGEGKTEAYYAVCRQISNKSDWLEFARGESYLNLPDSVVSNIEHDYSQSIKEQQYQMLVFWERKLGREASVEKLKNLADHYVGRRSDSHLRSHQMDVDGPQQQPTSHCRTGDNRGSASPTSSKFRMMLIKIGRELNQTNFELLQMLYSNIASRSFSDALGLLFYLDNHNLICPKTNASTDDKIAHLCEVMQTLDRPDLKRKLEECQRAFLDQDVTDATAIGDDPPGTSRGAQQHQQLQKPNKKRGSGRVVNNTMTGCNFVNSTVHQQAGDVTYNTTVNQDMANAMPLDALKLASLPNFGDFGLIQQLMQPQNRKAEKPAQQPSGAVSGSHFSLKGPVSIHIHQPGNVQQHQGGFTEAPHSTHEPDVENMCRHPSHDVTVAPTSKDFYDGIMRNPHQVYSIKSKPKGNVLIMSNVDFSSCWGERYNRAGGEKDCSLMKQLFGDQGLGFNVNLVENKTAESMWNCLEEFSKNSCHQKADVSVVFIMSHGSNHDRDGDIIHGSDGKHIIAEDVVRLFDNDNCPMLRGKPKLFFFQFCRGRDADKGVEFDHSDNVSSYPTNRMVSPSESLNKSYPHEDSTDANTGSLPSRSDVLIAYATQEGNLAFRSWFTNAIANVFSKKAHTHHLTEMLYEVKRGIAGNTANTSSPSTHKGKEMADIRDMLLKKLYFFPGFP